MATENLSSRASPLDLLSLFKGNSQSSTTKSNLTKEGAQAYIQQILESTQGLAAVSSGQKSAGLYNSTVNTQLTNDLLSRVSAAVAREQAGSTTTTKTGAKLGGSDLLSMFALKAGSSLLGPTVKKGIAKSGVDELGTKLSDAIFGTGGGGSGGVAAGADAIASDAWSNVGATVGDSFLESTATSAISDFGASVATDAVESAATDAAVSEAGDAAASEVAGQSWVICTELNSRGVLSNELYQAGVKRIPEMRSEVVRGYHFWAIPYTKIMRRQNWIGRIASRIVTPIALSRARYLAGNFNITGYGTVVIGESLCHFIGLIVREVQDWRTLYVSA